MLGVSLPASSAVLKTSPLPAVKIVGHPAPLSHDAKATFTFYSTYSDVDAYLCSLDRHAFRSCPITKTYRGLANGKHRFAVKIVSDGAAGPATTYIWTIKVRAKRAKAPATYIHSHPTLTTTATDASFSFSSNDLAATFKCAIDLGAPTSTGFSSCTSPATYAGLAPGYHTFTVTGVVDGRSGRVTTYAWFISAVAPVNTTAPAITGTAQVGKALTASSGSWTGSRPISYTYQWQLCSSGTVFFFRDAISAPTTQPVSCGDIVGATSASYTPTGSSLVAGGLRSSTMVSAKINMYYGFTLRVVVTASNAAEKTETVSSETAIVLPAAPVNTALPSISFDWAPPTVGDTAYGSDGSWLNLDYSYDWTYQWLRCDTSSANCSAIPDATSWDYVLADADIGSTLRLTVTAINAGGSTAATSLQTAEVEPPV
ncbi:MAG TPA: hypothetical protein VII83_04800 [Gaiellaceae bacterium]